VEAENEFGKNPARQKKIADHMQDIKPYIVLRLQQRRMNHPSPLLRLAL
jgi:hypothetical protein